MKLFYEPFMIRWSDIDANGHLANSAYVNFCSQTRLAFLQKHNIPLLQLFQWRIGPVILHESYSYFKEFYPQEEVYVSIELKGVSDDYSLFKIHHNMYSKKGIQHAASEVYGAWINTQTRRRESPPEELIIAMNTTTDIEKIEKLTLETIKEKGFMPKNLEKEF